MTGQPNTNSLTQLDSKPMPIPKSWGYRWEGSLKREEIQGWGDRQKDRLELGAPGFWDFMSVP